MEDAAHFIPFIPLGLPKGKLPFDKPKKPKVEGSTPRRHLFIPWTIHKDDGTRLLTYSTGERTKIAREVRNSNKKEKKLAKADAKRQQPRLVIPQETSLPEGKENFIAMWDITDEEIKKRIRDEKHVKSLARKNLRRKQKEKERFNQAMKLLKRQMENRGEKWDPEKAEKLVLKQQEEDGPEEDSQDSGSDSDSGNEDPEDIEQPDEPARVKKASKKNSSNIVESASKPKAKPQQTLKEKKRAKKLEKTPIPASNADAVVERLATVIKSEPTQDRKSKRPAEDALLEESKPKNNKKSKKPKSENAEAVEVPVLEAPLLKATSVTEPEPLTTEKEKNKVGRESHRDASNGLPKSEKQALKEEKRAKKEKKRQKKLAKAAKANGSYTSSKKRQYEDNDSDTQAKTKMKKFKSEAEPVNESGAAAQWNPDALTGEAARKEKFLRLLGAGKMNAAAADGARHRSSAKAEDISKVQRELERQYEAGMKMKHDGGGKRRGLGA